VLAVLGGGRFDGCMATSLSAADYFAAKLEYETDPADLAAARLAGAAPLVIDVRSEASWRQGRIPGAVHVPTAALAERIGELAPHLDAEIVVYCWGPGCNASTKAALTLAELGYRCVRELMGGYEYWAREGLVTVTDAGRGRLAPDPLAAPVQAA
jgi:rhodanese-related sulfurtransferase